MHSIITYERNHRLKSLDYALDLKKHLLVIDILNNNDDPCSYTLLTQGQCNFNNCSAECLYIKIKNEIIQSIPNPKIS